MEALDQEKLAGDTNLSFSIFSVFSDSSFESGGFPLLLVKGTSEPHYNLGSGEKSLMFVSDQFFVLFLQQNHISLCEHGFAAFNLISTVSWFVVAQSILNSALNAANHFEDLIFQYWNQALI
jgi:hypothetical protein